MEENKKKLNIIPVIIIGVLAVVGLAVALILIFGKKDEDSYRDIKVIDVNGLSTVTRDGIGDIDAYENMALETGDYVTVKQGRLTLKLDNDKYIYVEEGSELQLLATGDSTDSKTTINLMKGEITNAIQEKLSEKSVYEVCTPTATMSVRGTVFHVKVYEKDGVVYTDVNVLEGIVETTLAQVAGREIANKDGVMVTAGYKVTVYDDEEIVDFLTDMIPIDPNELPEDIREIIDQLVSDSEIVEKIKNGSSVIIGPNQNEPSGPFTVNFLYGGQLFGSQTVEKGGLATEPTLMPAPTGNWDYDFTQPVTADLDINWIE